MKFLLLALSLLLLLTSAVHAQSNTTPEPVEDQAFLDYSYAYGTVIIDALTKLGLEPNDRNVQAIIRGVQTVVGGANREEVYDAPAEIREYFSNEELSPEIQEEVSFRLGLIVTTYFFTDLKPEGKRFNNEELWASCRVLMEGRTPRLTEEEVKDALNTYLKTSEEEDKMTD